ncbi:hypothetical protein O9929_15850 [Vibrio lentus]|nr:hypothetical protein [Vibrio lentus]
MAMIIGENTTFFTGTSVVVGDEVQSTYCRPFDKMYQMIKNKKPTVTAAAAQIKPFRHYLSFDVLV